MITMIRYHRTTQGLATDNGLDLLDPHRLAVIVSRADGGGYVTRYFRTVGVIARVHDEKLRDAKAGVAATLDPAARGLADHALRARHVVAVTAAINTECDRLRAEYDAAVTDPARSAVH